MVINQEWFEQEYPKEEQEIECEVEEFEGQLVIEDYPNLIDLYLRLVNSIDKLTLRNLTQLQKLTIRECDVKELVIENCPQIKKLNIRNNQLTNLEFVKSLKSLAELEIDGNQEIDSGLEHLPITLKNFSCENTELAETLKPYQEKDGWKKCRKEIQKVLEVVKKHPHQLVKTIWSLQEEIKQFKERQPITIDNPKDLERKYKELKKSLVSLVHKKELRTQELNQIITSELMIQLSDEWKENREEVSKLGKLTEDLNKKLSFFEDIYEITKGKIKQKERELEKLKNSYLEKSGTCKKEKMLKKLGELLDSQNKITISKDDFAIKMKESIKDDLLELTELSTEELDNFCQKQLEITQLKLRIQKDFNQINQTFIDNRTINQQIKNIQGFNIEGGSNTLTNASVQGNTMETITYEEETADTELQAKIEAPLPKKYLE